MICDSISSRRAGASEDGKDAQGPRRQNDNSIDASQVRQRNEDKANVASVASRNRAQFTPMKRGRNTNVGLSALFRQARGTCKKIGEICPFDERCCSGCCRPPSWQTQVRRCKKVDPGKWCSNLHWEGATLH